MIRDKISEYIGRKYPNLRNQVGDEGIKNVVDMLIENTMYAQIDDKIVGVAIWLMINEVAVDMLRTGQLKVDSADDFQRLIDMPGNHYHAICLAVDDESYFKEGFKKLIEDKEPDSISWMRNNKVFYRRLRD